MQRASMLEHLAFNLTRILHLFGLKRFQTSPRAWIGAS